MNWYLNTVKWLAIPILLCLYRLQSTCIPKGKKWWNTPELLILRPLEPLTYRKRYAISKQWSSLVITEWGHLVLKRFNAICTSFTLFVVSWHPLACKTCRESHISVISVRPRWYLGGKVSPLGVALVVDSDWFHSRQDDVFGDLNSQSPHSRDKHVCLLHAAHRFMAQHVPVCDTQDAIVKWIRI